MIEINGKIYRNLQEQVKKNMEDIQELQESGGGGTGGTTYTSGEFIYVDNQEKTINLDYTNSGTIEFDTFEGRLWPKVIFSDGLNAGPNGLYVDNSIARSTKVYTKDDADQKFVPKNIEFDDEDNPETFKFKAPASYSDSLELLAIQDDNNHPCDSKVTVFPSRVILGSYDYNHGDNDDTYEGEIVVYDTSINLSVDTGDDEMHLRVTDSDISYSTDGTTYNSLITNNVSASTYQLALGTASNKFWFATITAEAGLEGTYGPENNYDWYTFITKYARYVNWYYENANDTTGNNHKSFIIKNPGQTLLFYGMDGSDFVPMIPPTSAYLTVTKTN